jgi:hypothetical protein
MKLGIDTNSFVNWVMSNQKDVQEVTIGMGGTVLMWTDRKPVTVIEIIPLKYKNGIRAVVVQEDTATRTDKNGMSDCQSYEFTRNPNGRTYTFNKTKAGFRGELGQLKLGKRDAYHDYSC